MDTQVSVWLPENNGLVMQEHHGHFLSAGDKDAQKKFHTKANQGKRAVYRPKSDGKVGFGGYIFSDKNGLIQRTGFQVAYAYHMWLQKNTQLSFGLAFTGYYYKIDETQINFEDPNEPWMNNNLRRGIFVPDLTFGAYLLNANYSLGFSADQLSEASAKIGGPAYKTLVWADSIIFLDHWF